MEPDKASISIPSLATLAYRVVRSDLCDRDAQKLIITRPELQKHENLFQEFIEMCQRIEGISFDNHGIIFGGYCRDLTGLEVPRDIDIRFSHQARMDGFVDMLSEDYNVQFVEKKRKYPSHLNDSFRVVTLLAVYQRFPEIFVPLDLTIEADWQDVPKDFDVNQLFIKVPGRIESTLSAHDHRILIKRIMAKVLLVFDAKGNPNADHCEDGTECICRDTREGKKLLYRMKNMRERGWTIEGYDTCSNPICILASEKAWIRHCDKVKTERQLKLAKERPFDI